MQPDAPTDAFAALRSADPYPVFAELLDQGPIQRTTLPNGRAGWAALGYEAAQAVLKDQRFGKDARRRGGGKAMRLLLSRRPFRNLSQSMLRLDPPDHTRLRALVLKAFTPRRVELLAPRIQELADGLIDSLAPRGAMELLADFASPLSVGVIAELLGIPREDRPRLVDWSHAVLKLSGEAAFSPDSSLRGMLRLGRQLTARPGGKPSALQTMIGFSDYLERLIADRRANPGDDLVSGLIAAKEQQDALSDDELLSMLLLLFIAGHETTTHLIGNGVLALLLHPEQRERLRGEPALAKQAVEEILRYNGPILALPRYALEDVEIHGQLIRKDEIVMVALAAANHDPAFAGCPHALDIERQAGQHLGFSSGIHYCLGAALARSEAQIAINTLLRRLPGLRLAVPPAELEWQTGRLQRGLLRFPVTF